MTHKLSTMVDGDTIVVDTVVTGQASAPRSPSVGEKDALAGTSGTPGSTNKYVTDADSRLTNSRAPSGSAGGDLSGTYPNPNVAKIHETSGPTQLTFGAITDSEFLTRLGTTITSAGFGSSAGTICEGNDSRLSDSRDPTGPAGGDLTGTYPNPDVVTGTTLVAGKLQLTDSTSSTSTTTAATPNSVKTAYDLANAAAPQTTTISTTSPLAGGGDLSANRTLSIAQATGSVSGYLSSTDWTTFNSKVSTTRSISTTAPLSGGGDLSANRTLTIAQSTTSTDGYLSSTDWNTFNNKVSTSRIISTTSPLNGGGDLSANRTLTIDDASTTQKGAVQLTNSTSSTSTTTAATPSSVKTAYDLAAAAAPQSRTISTTAPLTGGGDLSADRTLSIPAATGSVDGYLSSTDWTTFNNKVSTSRTISTTAPLSGGGDLSANRTLSITQSSGSVDGYLSSTDWTTFNSKVSTTRTISTTSPLTGGGDLSADRTLSIPVATTSVNGYLSSTDWTTFNNKVSTTRTINTTSPLAGGGNLSADLTLTINDGTTSQKGAVQLTDSTSSTSTTTAATPNSVKTAYDLANAAAPQTRTISTTSPLTGGGNLSADRTFAINDASTSAKGAVQLTDSVSSTSTTTAATPAAVKLAYDLAASAVTPTGFWSYSAALATGGWPR